MAIISGILAVLSLLFLVMAIAGLIKPSWAGQKKRSEAFGGGLVLFVVLSVAAYWISPDEAKVADSSGQEQTVPVASKKASGSKNIETELSANNSSLTGKAHAYKVIGAKEYSTKARKGGQWYIVSNAASREDRAATAIMAAQDLMFEMNEGQVASVWLFLDENYYTYGSGQVGEVAYIPDGKGKSGKEENTAVWQVKIANTVLDEKQHKIVDAWYQNRDTFKDKDDVINEDKLVAFLAQKFKLTPDEIDKQVTPFFRIPLDITEFNFVPNKNTIGLGIKRIGDKSKDSIKNPESFAISNCQLDLQCWAEKHLVSASSVCKEYVEKLAQYDFEWTDSWLDSKFSHYRWKDKKQGVITYIGDKIKLQNGFGAWQNYVYSCDFLPNSELGTVFDVQAEAGRL